MLMACALMALFLFQEGELEGDPQEKGLEPINAIAYMQDGTVHEMIDARLGGEQRYRFDLDTKQGQVLVHIYHVWAIERAGRMGQYRVIYRDGFIEEGTISSISFNAERVLGEDYAVKLFLHHMDRIQFISGPQPRSCVTEDYEDYTTALVCPRCNNPLRLGLIDWWEMPEDPGAYPEFRWRLDPRDPTGNVGTTRRRN
jgi:hypothetical protein